MDRRWSEKRQKLKELQKENLDLPTDLRQLKKAMDDITDLQKILSEKESEIAYLHSLLT